MNYQFYKLLCTHTYNSCIYYVKADFKNVCFMYRSEFNKAICRRNNKIHTFLAAFVGGERPCLGFQCSSMKGFGYLKKSMIVQCCFPPFLRRMLQICFHIYIYIYIYI